MPLVTSPPRKRRLDFDESQVEDLAKQLDLLADETRLKIMALLTKGEVCVCEIVDALQLPQSLVSHHLSVLRSHGLVRDRRDHRDGRWIYYAIEKSTLAALNERYMSLFGVGRIPDTQVSCDENGIAREV